MRMRQRSPWACLGMRIYIWRLRNVYVVDAIAKTMASPASAASSISPDVTDWVATPAPFNTEKRGERAKFSKENCVVERLRPEVYEYGCLAYTFSPLPLGQVWQTTVLRATWSWIGGLVSGYIHKVYVG